MSSKIVTVIQETRTRYEVEAGTGALTDDQAIATVKARMREAGSPLGLLEAGSKVTDYEVEEKVVD